MNTLFVHSSFRTASTWMWTKFRQPGVVTFYEPLNEFLGEVTSASLSDRRPDNWDSRHPATAPYFFEYGPLIDDVGVRGYSRAFAYDRFVPKDGPSGDIEDDEIAYFVGLIEHAAAHNSAVVFGCTRSLGRAYGLKQAVGGYHVLLYRPLLDQWLSYVAQYEIGQQYFVQSIGRTLTSNPHLRSTFARLLDESWVGSTTPGSVAGFVTMEAALEAFLVLHLYLYSFSAEWADLAVSTLQLALAGGHAARVSATLSSLAGVTVDFSDAIRTVSPVFDPTIQTSVIDRALLRLAEAGVQLEGLAAELVEELRMDVAVYSAAVAGGRARLESTRQLLAEQQSAARDQIDNLRNQVLALTDRAARLS